MDLISREELLKTFQVQNLIYRPNNLWNIVWIEELIKNAQSVEIPQWIPCSEGLPNVSRCIVDIGYLMDDGKLEHEIKIVDFKRWQNGFSFEDDWCNDITKNVIAWCPLPSVYKGD